MAVHAPDTAVQVLLFWQVDDREPVKPALHVALQLYPTAALSHVAPAGQALLAAVGRPLAAHTARSQGGASITLLCSSVSCRVWSTNKALMLVHTHPRSIKLLLPPAPPSNFVFPAFPNHLPPQYFSAFASYPFTSLYAWSAKEGDTRRRLPPPSQSSSTRNAHVRWGSPLQWRPKLCPRLRR